MEQLNLARQDQEQRMRDAVMQTSEEFEKSHKKLEEKLSETRKRLASLNSENSYLSKAVAMKEKLIEDLNSVKIQTHVFIESGPLEAAHTNPYCARRDCWRICRIVVKTQK
ncbi:uncharacterized protein LOC125210306 [Salvia hispanica]|uniref:uncharacterized protein LOC125210306 n=1 Tax=Salvia hispanica TaxID=49212 RepID=UPI00200938AE|nr:uncharacterized protein LOC125210306 [Salvia hispanica]